MYREGSRIACGETRFATFSDSVVEVRDPDGREVARLDGDAVGKLVGWYPEFRCAAPLTGDELVFHVLPRGGKGPGALVRHDLRTGKTAVHAHSDRLAGRYAPDEMVLDPAGALWMNHSGEGKTLVYILPPDGKLVTLKR